MTKNPYKGLKILVLFLVGAGLFCGIAGIGAGVWLMQYESRSMSQLPQGMPADAEMYGFFLGAILIALGALVGVGLLLNSGLLAVLRHFLRADRLSKLQAFAIWFLLAVALPVAVVLAGFLGLRLLYTS